MHLIYFDESKNGPDHPYYHIGGICIDERYLSDIESQVNAISDKVFGTGNLSRGTELHAVDIFHRKNNFKDFPDFGGRLEVFADFAAILSQESVQLIDVQINASKLYDSRDSADIAFMYFCERANDLASANESLGMLIGDRENDRVAARYSMTLSGYRADGTDYAYGRDIPNLVDSVHFTHSHLSRFLQLADVYTWLLQFQIRNRESEHPRHVAVHEILEHVDVNLFPAKYKHWPK